MRRNSHHGTGTISGQYIIANPNRNLFSGEGMNSICSGKLSANLFHIGLTFPFTSVLCKSHIFIHCFFMFCGSNLIHQLKFRSKGQE